MSLRWKSNRRLKELTTSMTANLAPTSTTQHTDAGAAKQPITSRRIELEIGVKGITGLPCSPSSPTSSGGSSGGDDGESPQTTVCVTWRKNGKLEHGEDKRRQREGITLTAKVGHDGACAWEGGRMSVVPCHIRKFDAKADVCDHKTVTFHVNQVVGSRTKKLKKVYEATLDLDRLTLYPTVYEEHLVLRPLGFRKLPSHHGIAWLLVQVRVLNFKELPKPSEPAASTMTNGDEALYRMNPRDIPVITSRTQSIGSAGDGDRSLGKAARRLSQQRVRSMPMSEEGKPKEAQGEEYGETGTSDNDEDPAERERLEREEAERYIRLYLDGYKEKTMQRQHKARDQAHAQADPRRDSAADRHDSHETYDERIAHYETVVRQMQETREQMHREIDELVQQLEDTKLDAARLLRELELHEARQQHAGGEEGPDEPLRTREAEETARMVDDLRSLIIEREDQLTELRDQVRRHTEEIDLVTRERDDERSAVREAIEHCHELQLELDAAEHERDEVRSTLDQVLSQASAMHDELAEKEIKLAQLEELAHRREIVGDEDVAAARQEALALREAVDEHRRSRDELTLRLNDKRRKYAERKRQLAALEGVISEKQAELDAMTRNRNELHQRCEDLEAERERLVAERDAERAAKESRRSEKAAEHQASMEQMSSASPNSLQHDHQPDQADRRLLHELSEAKKRLRHKRQEVVEFDQALAEMTNATRASEEQVAAWESQLVACRQRIAELGSPRSDARHDPAKAERGRRAIAECEDDIETLQHYVMAELDSMREVAHRYGRVRERRDETARACEELTQQASAIKHSILKTRKRSKARRTTSMTRAHSTGDVLSSEDRADAVTARRELESVRWEAKTRELIERHVWSYDSNKRQSATAGTTVKEILGHLQVFQPHGTGADGADALASLVLGLMRALARSHKRASGLEEQIHWLSFTCHLLHGLKSNPDSASFFHPAVFYSVPDPAESGVGVSKVKFRVQNTEDGEPDVLIEEDDALVSNYTSFLWMQKLHNLILSVYREIVALACASIEPVIAALMQPRGPQGPLLSDPHHNSQAAPSKQSGGGNDLKAQPDEAAGIRTFARSTRETLRGLGFMKTKPSEVAPAVLDSRDYETDKSVREFKRIVASLFELLIAEGVHETVVVQLCKQLFHHLDVSLFNSILAGTNAALRSPSHAVKIKYFLSQLVDWCLHHDSFNSQDMDEDEAITLAEVLQQSRAFLERHTAEATSLLVMDKARILEEGDNLRALFRHLNNQQVVQLLERIHADQPSSAPLPPVQLPIALLSFQQSPP